MKKLVQGLTLLLLTSMFSVSALGSESLRCYAFFGVTYKTTNFDNQVMNVEDTTRVILDQTVPIVNGQARIEAGTDQFRYDADFDGRYFRLVFVDKTNGQSNEYFGPSSSFAPGVDTCLFVDPAPNSHLQASWDDLEHKIGSVLPDSLRVIYGTVQCNKITDEAK